MTNTSSATARAKFCSTSPGERNRKPRAGFVFNGAVLLDGQVAGHWKQTSRAKSVHFEIALYEPLDEREAAALDDEIRHYGRFLALPATASVWVL